MVFRLVDENNIENLGDSELIKIDKILELGSGEKITIYSRYVKSKDRNLDRMKLEGN